MLNERVSKHYTVDELELWVNGRFEGFVLRNGCRHDDWNAWFDFWKNPRHEGRPVVVCLKQGVNTIIVRAYNGQFASGGFYLKLGSASTGCRSLQSLTNSDQGQEQ